MIKVDSLGDAHKPADSIHSVSCHVGYEAGNCYGIKNEEQQETKRETQIGFRLHGHPWCVETGRANGQLAGWCQLAGRANWLAGPTEHVQGHGSQLSFVMWNPVRVLRTMSSQQPEGDDIFTFFSCVPSTFFLYPS